LFFGFGTPIYYAKRCKNFLAMDTKITKILNIFYSDLNELDKRKTELGAYHESIKISSMRNIKSFTKEIIKTMYRDKRNQISLITVLSANIYMVISGSALLFYTTVLFDITFKDDSTGFKVTFASGVNQL
jgi:hypothetical protein